MVGGIAGLRESSCQPSRLATPEASQQLPDNMACIKAELERLREHTGLVEQEDTDEENAKVEEEEEEAETSDERSKAKFINGRIY